MATAAKEAREEIEGVAAMTVSSFLVLFETFVAVLIVDFAGFGFGEGFVGFGDFDEFLLCCLVSTVLCLLVCVCLVMPGGVGGGGKMRRTGSCQGGISCSAFGTPS